MNNCIYMCHTTETHTCIAMFISAPPNISATHAQQTRMSPSLRIDATTTDIDKKIFASDALCKPCKLLMMQFLSFVSGLWDLARLAGVGPVSLATSPHTCLMRARHFNMSLTCNARALTHTVHDPWCVLLSEC